MTVKDPFHPLGDNGLAVNVTTGVAQMYNVGRDEWMKSIAIEAFSFEVEFQYDLAARRWKVAQAR